MNDSVEKKIFGFSVFNEYIPEGLIFEIGCHFCEKYGWNRLNASEDESEAWDIVIKAASEEKDVWAIGTVLFYKTYASELAESRFAVEDEYLLSDLVDILESIEEKDAFTSFLLGRAYFSGRGAELYYERVQECFLVAYEKGIALAKLFELELSEDWNGIFSVADQLIRLFPDSHIVKFYLGYCYYYGHGTKKDRAKASEIFGYTENIHSCDPVDYYFLMSRYLLGLCYFHGYGVEKNVKTAERLFRFSAAGYNPEATYALAITELLSDSKKNPSYIFSLLRQSALDGYLPAVRKVMLCLRFGYGTEADKALYIEYMEYYDYYRGDTEAFSELGKEADLCDLIRSDGTHIKDTEIVEEEPYGNEEEL